MQIKNSYSFIAKLRLAWWLLRTKLLCRQARLIRFPFDIRGKRYIDLGKNLTTGVGCRLEAFSPDGRTKTLHLGNRVQLNDYVHICAMHEVTIGNNVLMAGHIYISDNSHGCYKGTADDTDPNIPPIQRPYRIASVRIGDNVWIGEGVVVLPGVTIGNGAIVGANSVVTKDIPAETIAVGQPACSVKYYDRTLQSWCRI
ncbi:MAG: acetyltransferase [Rikenella sp.]|nr:acetyltransferase [Rikenella sp.]